LPIYKESLSTMDEKERLAFLLTLRANAVKVQPMADDFIPRFQGELFSHFGQARHIGIDNPLAFDADQMRMRTGLFSVIAVIITAELKFQYLTC